MKADTPSMTRNLRLPWSPFNLMPGEIDPLLKARDKVAIMGTGGHHDAPLQDKDWEVWRLNNAHAVDVGYASSSCPNFRADRWFELHPRAIADDDRAVTQCRAAVCYVVDAAEWPAPDRHTEASIATFPRPLALMQGRNYMASTFSWQVALALALRYKEIGLWGVQLWAGREGIVERASLNYWLGVATGRGVKVTLPDDCYLLWHPAEYGLDYWKELEHVGRWVHHVKSTLLDVPERPPMPRPEESYHYEREAKASYDQALGIASSRWKQVTGFLRALFR